MKFCFPGHGDGGQFVHLGTLARAHGLKGELGVEWYADFPLRSMSLYLQIASETPKSARITTVRMHKGRPLALFEGIYGRTEAEKLRGAKLLLPEDELPKISEDDLFLRQLPGLEVVLHESGCPLGHIDHVEFPGEQEIWVIRACEGHDILFPAVDSFVVSVNLEQSRIVIDPPPGLLEIYLP